MYHVADLKSSHVLVHSAVYVLIFVPLRLVEIFGKIRKYFRFRHIYSKHIFAFRTLSLSIKCLVETRNFSMLSLAFIASSFRVTEEN